MILIKNKVIYSCNKTLIISAIIILLIVGCVNNSNNITLYDYRPNSKIHEKSIKYDRLEDSLKSIVNFSYDFCKWHVESGAGKIQKEMLIYSDSIQKYFIDVTIAEKYITLLENNIYISNDLFERTKYNLDELILLQKSPNYSSKIIESFFEQDDLFSFHIDAIPPNSDILNNLKIESIQLDGELIFVHFNQNISVYLTYESGKWLVI